MISVMEEWSPPSPQHVGVYMKDPFFQAENTHTKKILTLCMLVLKVELNI